MKKDKQMNVRLDKDMDRWISRRAKANDWDKSKIVRCALDYYRMAMDVDAELKKAKEQGK